MLAMVVNDNACFLVKRGAHEFIASLLAPTRESIRLLGNQPRAILSNAWI
ncbi:hypothetical protein PMI35_06186 [Pseudomonas sp. GM78]|nr:hypothetical protein PMI35_06186 [Pseudomonas sp. GM78]